MMASYKHKDQLLNMGHFEMDQTRPTTHSNSSPPLKSDFSCQPFC